MSERLFRYKAVTAQGAEVSDSLSALDRRDALTRLTKSGLVVTLLTEATASKEGASASGKVDGATRILVLRQLALLTKAGVDLLEALETIASGLSGEASRQLRETVVQLRRGEPLGRAFESAAPNYPTYVYSLISVGEASGRLPQTLEQAAEQLIFEDRIRRDIFTALTYPSFLVVAGFSAVGFLFYEVVPRFGEMIGEDRSRLDGLAAFVIGGGEFFRANTFWILAVLAVAGASLFALATSVEGRRRLYALGLNTPIVGALLAARERATWARVMSFALTSGVGLLEASALASASAPDGPFRRRLAGATRAVRAGKKLEEAFAEPGLLSSMDLSLLRSGQRSGSLAQMFGFIADRYEESLREALKRTTALIEPIAIGLVAIAVGAVALGLVTAMSSVYDTVM